MTTLPIRAYQYLRAPGRILRIAAGGLAVSTLLSPLFSHPTLRNIATGLGTALMIWWLGFQVRERTEEFNELSGRKPPDKLPPDR